MSILRISTLGGAIVAAASISSTVSAGVFSAELLGAAPQPKIAIRGGKVSSVADTKLGAGIVIVEGTTADITGGAGFLWRIVWHPTYLFERAPQAAQVTFAYSSWREIAYEGRTFRGWAVTPAYTTTCNLTLQQDGTMAGTLIGTSSPITAKRGKIAKRQLVIASVSPARAGIQP